MKFANRLKLLRREKGLTQAQLGDCLNLAESTISLYENGKRTPHYDILKSMALFFKVSLDFLLGYTDVRHPHNAIWEEEGTYGNAPLPVRLPVISGATLNPRGIIYETTGREEWVFGLDIKDGSYYWFMVEDDRMSGEGILPGDLVLIKEQTAFDSGDICLILLNNKTLLQRVFKEKDSIVLQSANIAYPPRIFTGKKCSRLRVLGKVVQLKRKLV